MTDTPEAPQETPDSTIHPDFDMDQVDVHDSTSAVVSKATLGQSVFEHMRSKIWKHRYLVSLQVANLAGGVPTDPKVAEGWLKTKLAVDRDDLLKDLVAKTMVERGMTVEEAIEEANQFRNLNGFKRTENGVLYVEGRQVKAGIKEAANIAWPKERWGPSKKGTRGFFAEHVFVEEDVIPLGVTAPDRIDQRFVQTFRGTGISYDEIVELAELEFHVITDHEFKDDQWATLWLYGEEQGIGATRSQGYGRYSVVKFEDVSK